MGGAKTRAHALRYGSVYLRRDAIQLAVIEALEDRRLLALVTWDGGGGDLRWDNALNWSGDVTPQSGDDAVVDVPGTIAVTISSDISVRSATVHENLTITSGRLTVAAPSLASGSLHTEQAALRAVGAGASFTATGNTNVNRTTLEALAGGVISLPNLLTYAADGESYDLTADGPGSRITLTSLTSATGSTSFATRLQLLASGGGEINLPALTFLGMDFSDTAVVVNDSLSSVHMPVLELTTSVDLYALGGGSLSLPALREFHNGNFSEGRISAQGTGSRIELPAVTVVSGHSQFNAVLEINAHQGGVVDLRNTTTVGVPAINNLRLVMDDTISRINLDSATHFYGVDMWALGGAVMSLPSAIHIDNGGASHGVITAQGPGSRVELPLVTTLIGHPHHADNLEVTVIDGGVIDLRSLATVSTLGRHVAFTVHGPAASIDLRSVTTAYSVSMVAAFAGTLSLPQLNYYASEEVQENLVSHGEGSVLDLPRVTYLGGNMRSSRLFLRTEFGGTFNLGTAVPMTDLTNIVALEVNNGPFNVNTLRITRGSPIDGHALIYPGAVINGNVINDSSITSEVNKWPVAWTINGNYTQTHRGFLNVIIGDRPETMFFDRLHVAGHASLCGGLGNGFVGAFPQEGDTYQIITSASRTGEFGFHQVPPFVPGLTMSNSMAGGSVFVHTVPNQPPTLTTLSSSPDTVPQGGSVLLTADGVADSNGSVTAVQFYFDADANGLFDPCFDPLVAADTDGSDGWSGVGSVGTAPPGPREFFARAVDNHHLSSAVARVLVTIERGANTSPVAVDDSFTTAADTALTGSVIANDQDPDNDPLTAILVSPPNGQLHLAPDGTFTYTPDPGFTGTDTFTYKVSDGQLESNVATVTIQVIRRASLSGSVFDDLDNDGIHDIGEPGISGVVVRLTGTEVDRAVVTDAAGFYRFDDLAAGSYRLSQDAQPNGFLDGRETTGIFGGVVDNTADSNIIDDIAISAGAGDAGGYLFAEIRPSAAMGLVWEDFNDDASVNFGEKAIGNVTIHLSGTDDRGASVSHTTQTDLDGIYAFASLRPGTYAIHEIQPAGLDDGQDARGTVNGATSGDASLNDVFSNIALARPDSIAENYNFGERPQSSGGVVAGQTATIGFWQNNNGQALIVSLNGGPGATQLGNWLASTFPNLYSALAGRTNSQVAEFYRTLFRRTVNTNGSLGLGGPPKVDAQTLSLALAVYVTNQDLAGTAASGFGFLVTQTGVGTRTFNVGDNGVAFRVADGSNVAVLDLLLTADTHSHNGVLYDIDSDGDADNDLEILLRAAANEVFEAINSAGDV